MADLHALPNALIPVVAVIGLQVPLLVGGTVVLEQIFSIPGMGKLDPRLRHVR